jgi:rubrerythrin
MATIAKSLKGFWTERNLVTAYAAESMAYSRYIYYAQQADKENYFPIGELFRQTADNELHHGKVFFKFLEGGTVEVLLGVDAGVIGDTAANLATAMKEEIMEGITLYRKSAKIALDEGFPEIADRFSAIADVEHLHYERFQRYLQQVKDGTVWMRDEPIKWRCLVCGLIVEGTEPPAKCPGCNHPREHYVALDFK